MNCENCEKLQKQGNSIKYCSQFCYYKSPKMQEFFKAKENEVTDLRKQIFNKIYNAGKEGRVVDENDPEIYALLEELENTYY